MTKISVLKIAFINPSCRNIEVMHQSPPFGILSLMAYCRKEFGSRIEMKYFDDAIEVNVEQFVKEYDPDVIGISSTTPTIYRAYELSDSFRKDRSGIVVLGGKHASALPQEALKHADYVVIGEGERGLTKLLNDVYQDRLPVNQIITSSFLSDLDTIPWLPWHVLNKDYYLNGPETIGSALGLKEKGASIGLLTSRGCPFRCKFCYNSKRKSPVRYFSPERVVSEVEYMINEWSVDLIFFFDDEFLSNKKRLRRIYELIREKQLRFKWACQARADRVDDEILSMIKDIGCVQVGFGLESGSPRILKFLKGEKIRIDNNKRAVYKTRKHGLNVFGNIILGTPTETPIDVWKSLRFVMTNPLDIVSTSIATAFPGTVLWDYCVKNNIFKPDDVNYEQLSMQTHSLYLNERYFPKKRFDVAFFVFRFYIFLFRRSYSFQTILKKIFKKIKTRSLDTR